jgi:hypothetical protein
MDIKMEQFLLKSGFTNTHISEKVGTSWIFFKFCKKKSSIYGLNFASFQNGGFVQNGHQKFVFLP